MTMRWIRKHYGVPARRGGRVEYTGEGRPELGTITSAKGSHLNIRLDGVKHTMPFHPTWKLRYLNDAAPCGCANTGHCDGSCAPYVGGGGVGYVKAPKEDTPDAAR